MLNILRPSIVRGNTLRKKRFEDRQFNPKRNVRDILGLYDANRLEVDDNASVVSFTDQGLAANHATQGTADNRGILRKNQIKGNAAVEFDGLNDIYGFNVINSITFSAFIVAKSTRTSEGSAWLGSTGHADDGSNYIMSRSDNNIFIGITGGSYATQTGDDAVYHFIEAYVNGTTKQIGYNGSLGTAISTASTAYYNSMGYPPASSFFIKGFVAWMLLINHISIKTEIFNIRKYARRRFSLPISLAI